MRAQVLLREAQDSDAAELAQLWADVLRRGDSQDQADDVLLVLDRVAGQPEERIVVAEVEGRVAGAVHLVATTLSPLNLEPVVWAVSPHVLPSQRRRGVGSALMEAAVSFADELGIDHVGTAVSAGARDSNRFMARLGLAPTATLRVAPSATLLGRLPKRLPAQRRAGGRQLTQLLAARRSMRRRHPAASP